MKYLKEILNGMCCTYFSGYSVADPGCFIKIRTFLIPDPGSYKKKWDENLLVTMVSGAKS
jgi:hypothetical protein